LDIVFGKGVVGKQGFVDIVWNQGLAPRSSEKLLSKSTPIGFNVLYIDAGPNAYQFSCRLISRSANVSSMGNKLICNNHDSCFYS